MSDQPNELPPLDERFEEALRGIADYMKPSVRQAAAEMLAERKTTIDSLDKDGISQLASEAYVRASDKNWSEILADPHKISSVPQDVWNPDKKLRAR